MRRAGRIDRFAPGTLTGRTVLVTCLVAVVAVLITAAVALPIAIRSANTAARVTLANQANVAAAVMGERNTARDTPSERQRAARVAQVLRDQNIETVLILDGQADRPGLPPRIVDEIAADRAVSQVVRYQGRLWRAEGRPTGDGDGIVLLSPMTGATFRSVLGRLWLALAAGLLAGALAGAALARRLGQPLRGVAAAARRLSNGDRTARVTTEGPAEVAAVAAALNDLAAALTASENRQRTFLMSISHELRTPLTAMKGYAEALADGVIEPADAQRTGQIMLAESEHLDRLVEDLLALARLEADDFPLEVMRVDLTGVATAAAAAWQGRSAAAGVVLRTEIPAAPLLVTTDPGRIRQVLDGLIENALRIVPAGAPVVIALRPGDGYAELEVRDGGPGFTAEDLAVAFDRGVLSARYRGVRKVGSGLGLALARRLVLRLGGTITAGHAPEGGARFTVRLPA